MSERRKPHITFADGTVVEIDLDEDRFVIAEPNAAQVTRAVGTVKGGAVKTPGLVPPAP